MNNLQPDYFELRLRITMSAHHYSLAPKPRSWKMLPDPNAPLKKTGQNSLYWDNKREESRSKTKGRNKMPGQANTKPKTTEKPPPMQAFTDAVQSVPEAHRKELLSLMQEFSDKVKHRPQRPSPTNRVEMREMGIETYPEFKKRTGSTDGKECLRQNWGEWLKAFNPQLDRDYISSADIRNLDLKLLGRLQRQYKTDELHQFLPSLPMRNAQIGKTRNPEEAKEMYRIAQIIERYAQHPS